MKQTKKALALLLSVVMAISMFTVGVFAANETDGKITINNTNPAVSMKGHTYTAYKLFDVTYDAAKENYSYSIGAGFEAFFAAKGCTTDDLAYAYVSALSGDELQAFAKEAYDGKTAGVSSKSVTATEANQVVIDGLEHGYYLVYDEGNPDAGDNETKAISASILTTTDPESTVELKADVPTMDKTITGVSDEASNVEGALDQDAIDAQIGEHVQFTLTSKVPDLTGYTAYTYTAHDTLSAGLTFDNNVKVMIGGVDKTSECIITPNGQSFTVTVPYATLKAAAKGEEILITYSATLNEDAIIFGTEANINTAHLEYSNNPNDTTSKDNTPDSEVKVYTFEMDITKRAKNTDGEVLPGAEFSLKDNDGNYIAVIKDEETGKYTVAVGVEGTEENSTVVSDANGKIYIEGLKAGTYKLTETKAPEGYNKLTEDVIVTITATYDDGKTEVTSVTGNTPVIVNKTGSLLPTTGGIGTTIFTVLGVVIMGAALTLMILKRRKTAKEAE